VRRTIAVATLFIAVACSSGTTPGSLSKSSEGSFPVTLTGASGSVTLNAKPTRIVSLSSTATEMLFAIGAGSQVVAADRLSNYPAEAPKTTIDAYQPNVEAITKYQPDLVVIYYDPGKLVKSLQKVSIPVIVQPAAKTLDDSYAQITDLGKATGHVSEAGVVVQKMKNDIQQIATAAPKFTTPPTYYYELESTYFSAGPTTFIGQLFGLLGLKNIAAKKAGDYPQLSPEYIIQANPDLIFLADTKCCHQSASSVAKRPGWKNIAAVKNGDVVGLDDDIASRWGPRIVDLLRTVADSLQHLRAAA
jgi:iron complex transport system substrate-binding protein